MELLDQHGNLFRLSSLRGKCPVVVYFYPKDETLVCTKEACGFRDNFNEFIASGTMVVGISADDVVSHMAFAKRHNLPFLLLSDPDNVAFRAFGLKKFLGMKERATFTVDSNGIILTVTKDRLNAGRHVREALATLRRQGLARL